MIYNGKYIEYDEKASAIIQTNINKSSELKTDLKSEISKPLDLIRDDYEATVEYSSSGYDMFNDNKKVSGLEERKTRYGYYKEMDDMEFIHRGLEIVADDSTQANTDGDALKIFSDDEGIKEKLINLFNERLDFNNELWSIVYETSKMGDNFFEVVPDNYKNPKKIVFLKYLNPGKMEKIIKNGKISHYEYTVDNQNDFDKISDKKINDFVLSHKNKSQKNMGIVFKLQPWQVIHFKMTDREYEPYGASLLKSGVRTFRRLSLLEDVMLVYRISRAPERRVFYIDVGNMNNTDAKRFLQKIKNQYRTQNFIDENGNINKKSNVLAVTTDIFVPQREGGGGTKIETLQGGQALNNIDDLDYFRKKILMTMNIPLAYLGEGSDRSRVSLSAVDIKFSRFIERVQSQILKGINKIAALELFFQGEKKENLANFKIELTPPSNIKEITDIELINQRMNLVSIIQQLNLFSNEWIMKNILKLGDKEIADISLQKSMAPQQTQDDGMGGMPAGGDMGMGTETGGMETGTEAETNTPENVPTEVSSETPQDLTASTLVKTLGKEFLIENSDDFAYLIKSLKNSKSVKHIPLIERIAEVVTSPIDDKKKKINKAENLTRQFILGEMNGLEWENGKGKSVLLYEKNSDLTESILIDSYIA